MRNRPYSRILLVLLLASWLRAEALPMAGALPPGARVAELARVEADAPVAVDPAGSRIAYVDHGLWIRNLGSGAARSVLPLRPTQLAWSEEGDRLAASFEQPGSSLVRIFDAEGVPRGETSLPGRVSGLQWRGDGILLILTVALETYRFGAQMSQVLHQWDGKGAPSSKVLNASTLMPKVANQVKDSLPARLGFALSPLQDEILYYRLYSPPALECHLRLMLYHLGTGESRVVAEVGMNATGASFTAAGDRIVYGDGTRETKLSDPWADEVLARVPVSGRSVAASPSGHYLLADGGLYQDGKRWVAFPAGTRGWFAKKQGDLFLNLGAGLYRLTGLQDPPVASLVEAQASRIRELRKWLSEGLIAPHEYRLKKEQP